MSATRGIVAALTCACVVGAASAARADAAKAQGPGDARAPVASDEGKAEASDARAAPPRPWLYAEDATLAAPMRVVAFTRATVADSPSPTRPFGGNLARPGGTLEAGGEVGLAPWASLAASGFGSTDAGGALGAMAGARVAPFASAWRTTHLVLSAGWLHELHGADGAWGRVAIAQDLARLRLATTVHGEHVFARGRDGVDVMVVAGASYAVAGPVRAGIEYVAQDLEGAFDDDEAEGMRHFVGPTASIELLEKRLSIVGGPAFGLTAQSPRLLGRIGVAFAY